MSYRTPNRRNKSLNVTLPSPTGGLNARDSLDKMAVTDAIVMDNYMPLDTQVSLRKGYRLYVQLNHTIKTLAEYQSPMGHNRFYAFGNGTIYDITSAQNPIDLQKSFHDNNWRVCQFKNRLFAVNGVDVPQTFIPNEDGRNGVWADLNVTADNLHLNKIINIGVSKQRLWFVESGSLTVWYSEGVAEVQGKLLPFDVSTIASKGGYLVAVGNWTTDGGQGMDDLTVFITSVGEVLVYKGTNPNNASDWTLKGVYQIGRPIGYNCLIPYQGDLVVICEDGYVPLSKSLSLQNATNTQIAFSNKIQNLVLERTQMNATKEGWQGIIYSRGGYALFNVPVARQFEQHVVNTTTGAWCRFTNIRSFC